MAEDYYQYLKNWLCSRRRTDDFETFKGLLRYWQKMPYPVEEFYTAAAPFLRDGDDSDGDSDGDGDGDLDTNALMKGLRAWIPRKFSKVIERAENTKLKRAEAENAACQAQTGSPLLSLPREIRDKIWDLVSKDNVIHVSTKDDNQPQKRARPARRKKYLFHICCSPKGYASVACPPGLGDHTLCSTSGGNTYGSWRQVCKQMSFEIPDVLRDVLEENALQFADLHTADKFLFGLNEENRSSIRHLRLALQYSVMHSPPAPNWEQHVNSWHAICNYFSNPWERTTLHMDDEELLDLRKPIYFYYSNCYYNHNSDRLYKRWQVGRGSTSWDIGISDLVYKGCPKFDIAMANPTQREVNQYGNSAYTPIVTDSSTMDTWLEPLLQFRNYDGLKFEYFNPSSNAGEICEISEDIEQARKKGIANLKDYLRGGPEGIQGPQICAFFAGRPFGSGERFYNYR